ncbi:MAG: hypothetical protein QXY52_05855 [Conexivisphaerales archaeon]
MKASRVMVLEYIAMMGVPFLLLVSVILVPFHGIQYVKYVVMALIGIGAIMYGAIGVKDIYMKGENKSGN